MTTGIFSAATKNTMLDSVFGSGTPASVDIGLSTADPGPTGAGAIPPVGGAYAPVTKTNNATTFPAASGGSKSNGVAVTFPDPSASWGLVGYFTVRDHATSAYIGGGALNSAKTIDPHDVVEFAIGALSISIS